MHDVKQARPDHAIGELLTRRWSPYVFSARPVAAEDLTALFEAARWAASSHNEQPWRYFVAQRNEDPETYERLLDCLLDGNRAWAQHAPVLALSAVSRHFERNGNANAAAEHDLGLANANLTFEATRRGLSVHQMIGIEPEKARRLFQVPEGFDPFVALALGYAAEPEGDTGDSEEYRNRDAKPRIRKPLKEFVFSSSWQKPWTPAI